MTLQPAPHTFQVNSVTVTDNANSWDAIIDCIDTATHSIHVGAFLWRDDNL